MFAWLKLGGAALAAGALAWLVDDYAWSRAELERRRGEIAEALAANRSLVEAAAALEAHHRTVQAALEAADAAAGAARAERDETLEALRHVDPSENCPLGPGLRELLDGLR